MGSSTTNRLQLSLVQVVKLVLYCAVASACVAPMLHLWQNGVVDGGSFRGLVGVALFESVLVPLVWVGLSVFLVSRGAWRDGLICALLFCSVSVALGIACWMLFAWIQAYWNRIEELGIVALALHVLSILALIAAAVWLSFRLWRSFTGPRPTASAIGHPAAKAASSAPRASHREA
jgi:hypothetical protein